MRKVGCQKVCKGPVVGLDLGGRIEWFGKVRGSKVRDAVRKALKKGKAGTRLWKHRKKKRSGKLR